MPGEIVQTGFSRVFIQEGGAGPNVAPIYMGLARPGAVSWPQGDVTTIKIPDPSRYNAFIRTGTISGERGDPSLPITARYDFNKSLLLKLARLQCDNTLHIHMGICKNPQDFNAGWDKIVVLDAARVTDYGTTDLGALEDSERAIVNEEVPFTGQDYYEIVPITFAMKAAAEITQEIMGIVICDTPSCGVCGISSDGCQVIFAVTMRAGGSPGQGAEVIYSADGGDTWGNVAVDTITGTNDPSGLACVGSNLVIVSEESGSLHYAALIDILAGTPTWSEVTAGFSPSGDPRKVYSANPAFTWIVGTGGYIYTTSDPTSSVVVQDAGVATTETLNAIHGLDELSVVAVGDNNAVVRTRNGGSTWETITGPAVGIDLNAVWMKQADEWLVGTADGKLYYTRDGGTSWAEKGFPGSGASGSSVEDIRFSTPLVGWMSHTLTGPVGRMLRTIDGGFSWYVAPEGSALLPVLDRINQIAVCVEANTVFGAGLAADGADGFIVKGA